MRKNKQLQRFQRFILNWNRCKKSYHEKSPDNKPGFHLIGLFD
ncbi:hypothetical protein CEV34_3839 [Brucella pseudogrignonensis]|uniref:Uncharacterized protein n=1 Tax=Brucella pseudogrignonensis TaxID=419475 RepID=A0A256G7H4_9HYPH|nr:hypothetical protein CEV34_3839 [Brucella pseudogrignonensis]